MRWLKRQVLAAVVILSQSSFVYGGSAEETIAAFEWFCVDNISTPEKFPKFMSSLGVEPMPPDKAARFLGKQTGTVWPILQHKTKVVILLTTEGACGLFGYNVPAEETKRLFQSKFRNRKMSSEVKGSELEEVFAISQKDPWGRQDVHILVVVKTSSKSSILFHAMPRSMLKENGLDFEEWP